MRPSGGVFPAQRSAAPSCSPLRRAGFTDIPHFAFIMEISLRDCETNTGVIELGQTWGFHSAHAVTAVYPTFEWSWKVLSQRVRAGSSGAAMPGLPGFLSSSDLPPLLPLLHHKCCHMFTSLDLRVCGPGSRTAGAGPSSWRLQQLLLGPLGRAPASTLHLAL